MKREFFVGGMLMIFLMLIFLSASFGASSPTQSGNVSLIRGPNNISFNLTSQMNVSSLVKLYPEIETVSYSEGSKTTGYVNVFGGVGKNFQINNSVEYQIYSSKNITLKIQ